MNKNKEINFNKLKSLFKKDNKISLVFIFGSYASGMNTDKSDIDIAILLKKDEQKYFKLKLKYLAKLKKILNREDVDLVILNEADTFLKHMVTKYGQLIYSSQPDKFWEFNIKTMRQYENNKHFAEVYHNAMAERIENNTFGIAI